MTQIEPFRIDVPQRDPDDLRDRLRRTRWPSPGPGADWQRGVPLDYLRPPALAVIHAGDWLLKLLVVGVLVGAWR